MKVLVEVSDEELEKLIVETHFKYPYVSGCGYTMAGDKNIYYGAQIQSMIVKDEPCDKCHIYERNFDMGNGLMKHTHCPDRGHNLKEG